MKEILIFVPLMSEQKFFWESMYKVGLKYTMSRNQILYHNWEIINIERY